MRPGRRRSPTPGRGPGDRACGARARGRGGRRGRHEGAAGADQRPARARAGCARRGAVGCRWCSRSTRRPPGPTCWRAWRACASGPPSCPRTSPSTSGSDRRDHRPRRPGPGSAVLHPPRRGGGLGVLHPHLPRRGGVPAGLLLQGRRWRSPGEGERRRRPRRPRGRPAALHRAGAGVPRARGHRRAAAQRRRAGLPALADCRCSSCSRRRTPRPSRRSGAPTPARTSASSWCRPSELKTKPKALQLRPAVRRRARSSRSTTPRTARSRCSCAGPRSPSARLPADVACIQAQLGYFNADQNRITQWFTAEYVTWFAHFLPGLVALGAPMPLGGTSNHMRADVLRELGAWDPYNVTEDADLGHAAAPPRPAHGGARLASRWRRPTPTS